MATVAAITAGGAILGGLLNAGGSLAAGGASAAAQQRNNELTAQGLADARNNQAYQRALSALINQRSIAGTTDSFGSSVQYDPATNQWVTKLGPLPTAAQTASDQAGIIRNTTDLRAAELANQEAARRATQAQPAADTALRNLTTFRPMGQDELVGLLQQQATNATNATFRPLVDDTLRSFQRSGTAAGPVLAQIGKTEGQNLRDSLIDAQIKGMTGVDAINQSRRSGLQSDVAATGALATPQFQYPGINTANPNATLANLVAARAQQAGFGPAYGASGVNTATDLAQKAGLSARSAGVDPTAEAAKQIGSMLQNKDFMSNIQTVGNKISNWFDPGPTQQQLLNEFNMPPIGGTTSTYYNPGGDKGFG